MQPAHRPGGLTIGYTAGGQGKHPCPPLFWYENISYFAQGPFDGSLRIENDAPRRAIFEKGGSKTAMFSSKK
ncbi:hypothetical protein, partial [Candidatus Allofournierella merdipullorum]|uniref:hypothetical protein n=1 Tax=Candidatus Allofournierella merdipullorum TaxID=2838595 RepID=UPI00374EB027